MHGQGTLEAYAGQLIELPGQGNVLVGGQVKLEGALSVYANGSYALNVTCEADGELFVVISEMPRSSSWLRKIIAQGGDRDYAFSNQSLQPLYSYGDDDYVPPRPSTGLGFLTPFAAHGYAEGTYGEGIANLQPIRSRGGDYNFSIGEGYVPSLRSLGIWGLNDVERMISYNYVIDGIVPVFDQFIFFSSTGTITDYFLVTKSLVQEFISLLQASSLVTSIAEVNGTIHTDIYVRTSDSANINYQPSLDNTARVWAVNIETSASGQYDNYGFTSFVEEDGKYYGVAEDGIYLLEGDKDVESDIQALIDYGKSNFGVQRKKMIHNVYVGVSSTGKLLLKVSADSDTFYYEANYAAEYLENQRFDLSKGLEGNFYGFTLLNQNGDDFSLAEISFEPITLLRKI